MAKTLRADAERSVRAILEAAERVLAENESATVEQIADAAGVTRTTVHRRFASRQAIIDALAISAKQDLADAIAAARPDAAPVYVALHRVTVAVLEVKSRWRYTLGNPLADTSAAKEIWAGINAGTLALLTRAGQAGLLAPEADLEWARRVYYALLKEAIATTDRSSTTDHVALATLVLNTLLEGIGQGNRAVDS
ncbi:TetR/AcrR family transcriptional regulator [Rathayibacter tanaceti]|uniref:Bacterial regulatory protein, tetR family n=2 Tax=Rathayibacter tanaceti TaxID=1671680 RepID=A0A166ICR3_9MICO|nr:helix-turn-helix domain-containing protein [Rathayibacter tanaceti]KZX22164.1 Bacterial regulatory protein, tetR family [Rathayibacter tanaceti]QHC54456.1 TetR family transcriptional regulator [Rathayibacter tanaceti]TCO35058.1 TetR family transcriptional regulator [Rathayibacter tanaceti]